MLLCKKIRLQASRAGRRRPGVHERRKCGGLYNWLVIRLRDGERWHFAQEKAALKECRTYDPELNDVYGKLLAEVYFRLDKAMQAFFRRVQNGETPGFPRVRPRHGFFTLCYPAMYLKVEGNTVLLPTGGRSEKAKRFPTIRAELTESVPAGYKEVAISRDARGHYYASFVYPVQEETQQPGQVVAFDLGIKTLATGVNGQGRFYHIGGFKGYQWYVPSSLISCAPNGTVATRGHGATSTCPKSTSASRRRSATSNATVCTRHLISSRANWLKELLSSVIFRERQMVMKEHEAHQKAKHRALFNEWGLYGFVQMLSYKCLLAGKELVLLDERDTSKTCSGCGHKQPMPLYKRTYRCGYCGLVMDRDDNSAVNIRERFLARLGPQTQASA